MTLVTEISRKHNCSRDSVTVTRVLEVEPYSDWGPLVTLMLGGVRLYGGMLWRIPPVGDPYIPWAFCKSVDVEGVGVFSGNHAPTPQGTVFANNSYRRARLTCQYETITFDDQDMAEQTEPSEAQEMDLATQSFDVSAQQLTLPGAYFRFQNSPKLNMSMTMANAVKVMPQMKYVCTRHLVVNKPLNAMLSLVGRVNSAQFTIGKTIFPQESLRFEGGTTTQKITNLGVKCDEVQYTFSVQPVHDLVATSAETVDSSDPKKVTTPSSVTSGFVGWNRIYRADRGYWDKVLSTDPVTGQKNRPMYQMDSEISQTIGGKTVSGFKLLFNPGAI